MWKILNKSGIAHLFTATYQNKIVTAWIIFVWKDTVYYPYGASSRITEMLWRRICFFGKLPDGQNKQGFFYFDLWGAMGPNPDTTRSLVRISPV